MSDAAERHAAFVTRLRDITSAPAAIIDAFARVPRHHFLPGVPLHLAYADDAVVTRNEGGIPTSSSSQPSLMARMLDQLGVQPGEHVLEVGTGTGYNAAVLAAYGAAVTTIEVQADLASAATARLGAAGIAATGNGAPAPGSVRVVAGDAAQPPAGRYDRVIVTAGCWALPAALVDAVADGGVLVAPLRINGMELALALAKEGAALRGAGGLPCGFLPLQAAGDHPQRWALGAGGFAIADADLGVEGRGALDRLLATPGRAVADPLGLSDGEDALAALLWLALQGDPLITIAQPRDDEPASWTIALNVLPTSLLLILLGATHRTVGQAVLHGADGALRAAAVAMKRWRAAGAPGPDRLELTVEPGADRTGWSLPYPAEGGAATMTRGAHRWTARYGP